MGGTAKSVLSAAKYKIADEKNWTRGTYARDALGQPISPACSTAVCFCSVGAISSVADRHDVFNEALKALHAAMGRDAFAYNDTHTHEEVLAAFDRAIKASS